MKNGFVTVALNTKNLGFIPRNHPLQQQNEIFIEVRLCCVFREIRNDKDLNDSKWSNYDVDDKECFD